VAKYREYDEDGNPLLGEYAQIFEEEYTKLINREKYRSIFEEIRDKDVDVNDVHKGYFSSDKKSKASNSKEKFAYFKDTSGSVKADEDTYQLIMRDKEKLLSFDSPVRFIFSHTALKEGWDNPNVFQICLLKEMGASEIRRRQEIGRGLRIAVNQDGERVYNENVNILTTVVNESFSDFVEGYQKELTEDTGIRFGYLTSHSFNLVVTDIDEEGEAVYLGQEQSTHLFAHFLEKGYIDSKGKIQDTLKAALKEDTVDLGREFDESVEKQLVNIIKEVAGSLEIKNNDDKVHVAVNKEVYLSDDFRTLWDSINRKTMYKVNFDSEQLIAKCMASLNDNLRNQQASFVTEKGVLGLTHAGLAKDEGGTTYVEASEDKVRHLPDIISYLQNETDLTRRTIVKILKGIE